MNPFYDSEWLVIPPGVKDMMLYLVELDREQLVELREHIDTILYRGSSR